MLWFLCAVVVPGSGVCKHSPWAAEMAALFFRGAQIAKPPAHAETGGFAFPHTNAFGAATSGVAEPECKLNAPPIRRRKHMPQAAFSWRWNSKQQSRRRYAANGFALLPQCRFLGRQRWVVEPAVKPVGCLHTFVPVLPLRRGRHQSDRRRIAPVRSYSSANRIRL